MYMSTQLFRSMIAFLCLFSNIKNIHSHRCTRDLSIYTKRLLVSKKVAEGIRGRSCVLKPKDLRGRNEQQWNCFLIYFGYTENVDVDAKLLVLKTFNESDTKLCESCYIFETGGQIYKRKDGIGLGFQEKGRFILIHDPETNVIGLYALLSLTQGSFFNIGRDGLQFGNYQDDYLSVKRPCVSILIKFFVRTKEFSEVNKKLNLGIDEKSKYIVKLEKINQDTMKFQNYTKKEDIKENADISGNSPLNSNSHNNMNQTGNDQPVRVEPIPIIPIDDKKKQSRFYRSASSDKDKIKVGQSNVSKGSNVSEQSCMSVQGVVTHQSNEPEQTNESKQTGDSEQTDDSEQSFVSEQTNEQKQQIISKQTTVSKQSFVSEQPTVLKQTDKSFKSTIFEQTTVSIVTLREEQPYSSLRPAVTEETCKLRQLVLSEQMYKANEKAVSKQLFVSEEHGISKKQIFLKQPQIAEESNIIEQPKILKHIDTIKQETVTSQTNNLTRRKDEIKELVAINLSLPQTKSISENKEYSSKPSQSKHKQGESVQQRAPNQEVFIKQRHVTERERLPQQHTSPTELLPARSSDSPTLSEYSSHRNTFISSNALLNSQHSIQIEHFQNSENQNETEYSKSIELPYNQVKPMDGQKPSNRGKNKKVFLLVISIFFFLVAGIVCLFYIIRFKTDKQRVIYES